MPAQSRLLPLQKYSGLDIIPFIAEHHPITLHYIFENLPLAMTLKDHHFHSISQKIQLAANPLLDSFDDLPGTIDPDLLDHISI